MKRNRFAAILAALFLAAAPCLAQAQATAAPATKAEAAPVQLAQGPGQSSVKQDARHCLSEPTNTEIIKCAEKYLPSKK